MKKYVFYLVLVITTLYVSCNKDDDKENDPDTEMSNAKQITSFQFSAVNNETLSEDVLGSINQNNHTITINLPSDTDITALTPEVAVSTAATYSPTGTQNFTNPVIYTVTAEDNTEAEYVVNVVVSTSDEAEILSFKFLAENNATLTKDVELNIDHSTRMVTITLPKDTEESILTTLIPSIVISEGASLNNEGEQDFSSPVIYTVTSESGEFVSNYTVIVTIEEDGTIEPTDLADLPEDIGGTHEAKPEGSTDASLEHYIYVPGGYDSNDLNYPLIVFLHGQGEAANYGGGQPLSAVTRHGPPKLIEGGTWNPTYPTIVASPQAPNSGGWNSTEIHDFITYLTDTYRVNPQRIYLTGLSLGGMGTWTYVGNLRENSYAAAIVPICGRYSTAAANRFLTTPIWAFHGAEDRTIEAFIENGSVPMIEAINELSPDTPAKVTIYTGVGHDSWTRTYDGSGMGDESDEYDSFEMSIYDWMFQYKKE